MDPVEMLYPFFSVMINKICILLCLSMAIYFGANHSFNPKWSDEWTQWENLISTFLIRGFWCTLDFDVQYAESLLESNLIEYNCFIPMVSVRLPYIRQFNYNTVIK